MSASDGVTREDPVAMTDAPAVSSPPKGSAPTAPTPQDSERRRSGRKVSVPAPFYPVGSEGEETKPPAPATSAPRSGGGARAPRGGSTRAKRTSSTPTSGSAASPDDDVMPFSVMDFVAPSEDLPEGLSTMPAIMPWSGARGRRYFLDYAPTEAGYVKAMQDYVSLFTKDNVVQFDVLAWDEGAGAHVCADARRLRAYYAFPDRNKTRVLGAVRAILRFFGLGLSDVALQFPIGVSPHKWDGRTGGGAGGRPDDEELLDHPLAVAEFKRLTRSPGDPLPVVTIKAGGPGCGPLPEAFRAALDALRTRVGGAAVPAAAASRAAAAAAARPAAAATASPADAASSLATESAAAVGTVPAAAAAAAAAAVEEPLPLPPLPFDVQTGERALLQRRPARRGAGADAVPCALVTAFGAVTAEMFPPDNMAVDDTSAHGVAAMWPVLAELSEEAADQLTKAAAAAASAAVAPAAASSPGTAAGAGGAAASAAAQGDAAAPPADEPMPAASPEASASAEAAAAAAVVAPEDLLGAVLLLAPPGAAPDAPSESVQVESYEEAEGEGSTASFLVTFLSGPKAGEPQPTRVPAEAVLAAFARQQAAAASGAAEAGAAAATPAGESPAGKGSAAASAPSTGAKRGGGGGSSKQRAQAAAAPPSSPDTVTVRFLHPALAAVDPASAAVRETLKTYVLLRETARAADAAPPPAAAAAGAGAPSTAAALWPGSRFEAVAGTEGRFVFNRAANAVEVDVPAGSLSAGRYGLGLTVWANEGECAFCLDRVAASECEGCGCILCRMTSHADGAGHEAHLKCEDYIDGLVCNSLVHVAPGCSGLLPAWKLRMADSGADVAGAALPPDTHALVRAYAEAHAEEIAALTRKAEAWGWPAAARQAAAEAEAAARADGGGPAKRPRRATVQPPSSYAEQGTAAGGEEEEGTGSKAAKSPKAPKAKGKVPKAKGKAARGGSDDDDESAAPEPEDEEDDEEEEEEELDDEEEEEGGRTAGRKRSRARAGAGSSRGKATGRPSASASASAAAASPAAVPGRAAAFRPITIAEYCFARATPAAQFFCGRCAADGSGGGRRAAQGRAGGAAPSSSRTGAGGQQLTLLTSGAKGGGASNAGVNDADKAALKTIGAIAAIPAGVLFATRVHAKSAGVVPNHMNGISPPVPSEKTNVIAAIASKVGSSYSNPADTGARIRYAGQGGVDLNGRANGEGGANKRTGFVTISQDFSAKSPNYKMQINHDTSAPVRLVRAIDAAKAKAKFAQLQRLCALHGWALPPYSPHAQTLAASTVSAAGLLASAAPSPASGRGRGAKGSGAAAAAAAAAGAGDEEGLGADEEEEEAAEDDEEEEGDDEEGGGRKKKGAAASKPRPKSAGGRAAAASASFSAEDVARLRAEAAAAGVPNVDPARSAEPFYFLDERTRPPTAYPAFPRVPEALGGVIAYDGLYAVARVDRVAEPPDFDPARPDAWRGAKITRVYFDLERLPEAARDAPAAARPYYGGLPGQMPPRWTPAGLAWEDANLALVNALLRAQLRDVGLPVDELARRSGVERPAGDVDRAFLDIAVREYGAVLYHNRGWGLRRLLDIGEAFRAARATAEAAAAGGGGAATAPTCPEHPRVLALLAADTANAARWARLRAEVGAARVTEGPGGQLLVPAAVRAAVATEFLDPITQEAAVEPLGPLACCGGILGAASARDLHRAAAGGGGSGRPAECPHCRAPLAAADALPPPNAALAAALAVLAPAPGC